MLIGRAHFRGAVLLVGAAALTVALLSTGCVWGVVRDAETGRPLAGASVSYVDSYGDTGSTTSDGNGLYVFDQSRGPVPARGPVTFQVSAPSYGPFEESRQVEYNDGPQPTFSNLSSFWEVQSFGLTASAPSTYEGQPALGPADARVVMVEFADFQCPYCARFAQDTLPQIIANYGDRVLFVFRNLPLSIPRGRLPTLRRRQSAPLSRTRSGNTMTCCSRARARSAWTA